VRQLRQACECDQFLACIGPNMKGGDMAYTPELNREYSAIVRRMAWSMDIPMTKTLNILIDLAVERADTKLICEKCRDNSFCPQCVFRQS